MPAQLARGLIHGAVERVAIDGRRGCVEPDPGRVGETGNHPVEQARGVDARVVDGFPVGVGVAAVDVAAGQVDADVGAFEVLGPGADMLAIPVHGLPGRSVGPAGEDGDVVAALLEVPREHLAHLAAAAGKHDAQGARKLGTLGVH